MAAPHESSSRLERRSTNWSVPIVGAVGAAFAPFPVTDGRVPRGAT